MPVEAEPKTPTTPTTTENGGENGESVQDSKEMEAMIKRLEKFGKVTARDEEHWRKILEEDDEVSSNLQQLVVTMFILLEYIDGMCC